MRRADINCVSPPLAGTWQKIDSTPGELPRRRQRFGSMDLDVRVDKFVAVGISLG